MPHKPSTDVEILERLDGSLADDVLTDAYTDEDIDAALRAMGSDQDAVARRGAALGTELLKKRRLAWQDKARRKIARAQPLFAQGSDFSGLGKPAMLAMLREAMNKPGLSGPVRQMFHQRKAEESSEDELRALLGEVEALARLDGLDDDDK